MTRRSRSTTHPEEVNAALLEFLDQPQPAMRTEATPTVASAR
jgi:hypothetical protein